MEFLRGAIMKAIFVRETRGVLDFEAIALDVHGGIVDIIDTISGDVLNSEPIAQFVRESVQFAMADAE